MGHARWAWNEFESATAYGSMCSPRKMIPPHQRFVVQSDNHHAALCLHGGGGGGGGGGPPGLYLRDKMCRGFHTTSMNFVVKLISPVVQSSSPVR